MQTAQPLVGLAEIRVKDAQREAHRVRRAILSTRRDATAEVARVRAETLNKLRRSWFGRLAYRKASDEEVWSWEFPSYPWGPPEHQAAAAKTWAFREQLHVVHDILNLCECSASDTIWITESAARVLNRTNYTTE